MTLLGRPAHLAAIRDHGLVVSGLFGDPHVSGFTLVLDGARLVGRFGSVLLTLKSFDTATIAALVAPHVAPDGVVISLQNGLGNVEEVTRRIGPDKVLGGRVIFAATVPAPGHVHVTVYAEPVMLGSVEGNGA